MPFSVIINLVRTLRWLGLVILLSGLLLLLYALCANYLENARRQKAAVECSQSGITDKLSFCFHGFRHDQLDSVRIQVLDIVGLDTTVIESMYGVREPWTNHRETDTKLHPLRALINFVATPKEVSTKSTFRLTLQESKHYVVSNIQTKQVIYGTMGLLANDVATCRIVGFEVDGMAVEVEGGCVLIEK